MARNSPWADALQDALGSAVEKVTAATNTATSASRSATASAPTAPAVAASTAPTSTSSAVVGDSPASVEDRVIDERPLLPPLRPSAEPRFSGAGGGACMEEKRSGSWWPLWVAGGLLALSFARSFVVVGAGERAVVFNRFSGVQKAPLGEGLHLLLPWVQSASVYDVKTHTYTMSASTNEANQTIGNANDALSALTSDGLPVSLEMSVQYHVDPENVAILHQNLGPQFVDKVVRPQTRSHVRMVVSKYPVTAVYGAQRAKIGDEINARLRAEFAKNNIVLENALLRDVAFSPQFQQAIERKQVAQQEVARMAFVVQQADKERRRRIIQAEGEAEAIRLKARALSRNPGLTQYEYVQNLPANVRTIVTDGRTIVNLGDVGANAAVAVPPSTSGASAAAASALPEPSAAPASP